MQYLKNLYKRANYRLAHDEISEDEVPVAYWSKELNFGDLFNRDLFCSIFPGKKIKLVSFNSSSHHIVGIGSILQLCGPNSVVAGSGFISRESELIKIPSRFISVRGKLTAEKLKWKYNVDVQTYGDLGLCAGRIFDQSNVKQKYKFGIIPHYTDYNYVVNQLEENEDILIIDIRTDRSLDFFRKINQCQHIISSSLHGLIFADAFQIPNQRMRIGDKIVGGDYKFLDYFSSVNRDFDEKILTLNELKDPSKNATLYLGELDQEMLEKSISEIKNAG